MEKRIFKIKDQYIDKIIHGQKIHEYRLAEPKNQSLKINDKLILKSIEKDRYIIVRIKNINIYVFGNLKVISF